MHDFDFDISGPMHILEPALALASETLFEGKQESIAGWLVQAGPDMSSTLILLNTASEENGHPFLAPLSGAEAFPVVKSWLESKAQYPSQPNSDGTIKKGFRIHLGHEQRWGILFAVVEPKWVVYQRNVD